MADDAAGVVGCVVPDQAAGDLPCRRGCGRRRPPPGEVAVAAITPIGSRLFRRLQGFDGAIVEGQAAGQLQVVGQPLLAGSQRGAGGVEQGAERLRPARPQQGVGSRPLAMQVWRRCGLRVGRRAPS